MKSIFKSSKSLDPLQKTALGLMMSLVLITFLGANMQALLWQSSEWLVSAVLPAVVIEETNEERSDLAISPLRRNSVLDEAATLKAQHMAENEYFSHFAPDGTSPWYWFNTAGYSFAHAGENLAIHFTDSSEVVEAWMDSPTHRANIVNGMFTEIGVGTAKGTYDGYETVYVVQLFGTPAAFSPAPTPLSVTEEPEPQTIVTEEATVESPQVAAAETTVDNEIEETPNEETVSTEENPSETPTSLETTNEETNSESTPVTEPQITTEEVGEETTPAETLVAESMIATSSGLTPVSPATIGSESSSQSDNSIVAVATKPNTILAFLYTTIAMIVFMLLAISLVDEARKAHPIQVSYSLVLLAVMGGLWWIHSTVTSGAIIV